MPRRVHMAPKHASSEMEYVVEKIIVLNGVAVAELAGETYVALPGPKRWSGSLVESPLHGSLPRQARTYRIWTSRWRNGLGWSISGNFRVGENHWILSSQTDNYFA